MPGNGKADKELREQVADLLRKGNAHVGFEPALEGWPADLYGARPDGSPHTAWQLLEHLRIAQWDILEFSRNPQHESPAWPEGYWPSAAAPPGEAAWNESIRKFQRDLRAMIRLVRDPKNDLHKRIPHGTGQTLLREALVLADHNSYHLGQLVLLRRLLGAWDEK
jgi:hypothetical protein